MKKYVDIRNIKPDDQKQKDTMLEIIRNGDDPFSMRNLAKYHKKPIKATSKDWILTENQYYTDADKRLLLILKKYKENFMELTSAEWSDLRLLLRKAIKTHKIKGGGFAMRFGDTEKSGATVKHLHSHLIEPNPKSKNYQPVSFFIGRRKTEKK